MSDLAVGEQLLQPKLRADFGTAEKEAARILDEMGVERPPVNPMQIAQRMGVQVVFVEFDPTMRSVSGFYDADEHAIYVNKNEAPFRQTFTVAHELGHHVLHQEWAHSTAYRVLLRDPDAASDFYEQEANAFAAHLLVPREMLARYKPVATVEELSRLFLVSAPVIRNRLATESRRG